jgi:hypothetical protein
MLTDRGIQLDFIKVDSLPRPPKQDELTLKVKSPYLLRFGSDSIKVASEAFAKRDGFYLFTLRLKRIPGIREARLDVAAQS